MAYDPATSSPPFGIGGSSSRRPRPVAPSRRNNSMGETVPGRDLGLAHSQRTRDYTPPNAFFDGPRDLGLAHSQRTRPNPLRSRL